MMHSVVALLDKVVRFKTAKADCAVAHGFAFL